MSESDLRLQIDAAKAYESLFVPALFGQWTTVMIDAAGIQPGQQILDVACGTGVLAREVVQHVGKDGVIAGLDPNPGMLAVAKEISPEVDWRQGAAEDIPFAEDFFDNVMSQFGLMFFQDRAKAIQEILRTTKSNGSITIAVWDSIENIAGYLAEMNLIERFAGETAAEAVRAPFVLGNQAELRDLFSLAGGSSIEIQTAQGVAQFPTIRTMVEAELRGWLPVMGVHLSDDLIEEILGEAEHELAQFKLPDGRVVFDVSAHIVTARKTSAR